MEIKIQSATIKNLKDIQELNHQLYIKENKEFDSTINKNFSIQKSGENYFKKRIKNDCTLIATVDGKTIGYLVGAISEVSDYRSILKLAEAENMFVLEEYRSLGVGKKLMNEFVKWCKSNKIKRMRVVASAQNIQAIKFRNKTTNTKRM